MKNNNTAVKISPVTSTTPCALISRKKILEPLKYPLKVTKVLMGEPVIKIHPKKVLQPLKLSPEGRKKVKELFKVDKSDLNTPAATFSIKEIIKLVTENVMIQVRKEIEASKKITLTISRDRIMKDVDNLFSTARSKKVKTKTS